MFICVAKQYGFDSQVLHELLSVANAATTVQQRVVLYRYLIDIILFEQQYCTLYLLMDQSL